MNVRPIDADALVVYLYKETEECIAMEDHVPEQFKEYYRGKMEAFFKVAAHVKRHTPTLNYAPVRHGEFERQEEEYIVGLHVTPVLCKTCNTTYFTTNKEGKRATCCPYCGALLPEPPKEEK